MKTDFRRIILEREDVRIVRIGENEHYNVERKNAEGEWELSEEQPYSLAFATPQGLRWHDEEGQ